MKYFPKLQKTTQRQMLNVLQKQCDLEQNEGGRLLVEWYKKTLFKINL